MRDAPARQTQLTHAGRTGWTCTRGVWTDAASDPVSGVVTVPVTWQRCPMGKALTARRCGVTQDTHVLSSTSDLGHQHGRVENHTQLWVSRSLSCNPKTGVADTVVRSVGFWRSLQKRSCQAAHCVGSSDRPKKQKKNLFSFPLSFPIFEGISPQRTLVQPVAE